MLATFPSPKGGGPIEAIHWLNPDKEGSPEFPSPKGGGPIEAIHWLNPDKEGSPEFPSPKGGGPIEARRSQRRLWYLPGFHRRKAVAPLKRRRPSASCHLAKSEFPSPKGGGPIEAAAAARAAADPPPAAQFPSPKGGGPIEANNRKAYTRVATRFPSPKGGGPIEAMMAQQSTGIREAGFHRRKAVAPLKQCHWRRRAMR